MNSAVLTVPDARGSNGIVHIVSDVIYPIPEGDLWKTLESCHAFSSFTKLVRDAELQDILSNTGFLFTLSLSLLKRLSSRYSDHVSHFYGDAEREEKWTMFVPVNAAFLLDETNKNDTGFLRGECPRNDRPF